MSEITVTEPSKHTGRRLAKGAGRRGLRALAIAMVAVGALALSDAIVTLVWQEPISALYALIEQEHLEGALSKVERTAPTPLEQRHLASLPTERRRVAYLAGELQRHTADGSPVGKIVIPEVNASYVFVKGTGTSELESGPGVYPETVFPGIQGTTAIAGHRTTWLAPFRHIDALRPGNHILLYMPYAHFTYTVVSQRVVLPSDVRAAVQYVGYKRLVLSACTPLFSAAKRLLIYAKLTRTVPVGPALWVPGGGVIQPIEAQAPGARPKRPAARQFEGLAQAL
jgi:sortase A